MQSQILIFHNSATHVYSLSLSEKKKFQLFSSERGRGQRKPKWQVLFEARGFGGRNRNPNGPSRPTRAPIVRHRVEFESGESMVREVGKFGVARLESRSGAALIYTSGQDQQPGELFSRCVSYLFIGGWDRLEPILARARESGRLSSPFRLPFLAEWKAARRKSERRAEVTPAPRRSRGRAPPVRFDAFLSPPSPSAGSVSSLCHLPESFNAVLTYG